MKVLLGGVAAIAAFGMSTATAAEPACNRDCLAGVMNTYLRALLQHDPAAVPMTRNVKVPEQMPAPPPFG